MKRFLSFLTVLLLILSLLPVGAGAATLSLSSESALLMEKSTGRVLYAMNEHARLEPASVTKVMTLLLTMEAIDAGRLGYDDTVCCSAHAAGMGGSQVYLKEGEEMTVRELLKAVCVASGNDAAVALAEHIAGSEEEFVAKMNARAAELGMADTVFCNCSGLPAEGHLTSAYDIALMSRELILHHPDIRSFTTIWMDSLRNGTFTLSSTNKLLRQYSGCTGLKTGSTSSAGFCISATAEKEGMELIAVTMNAQTGAERSNDAKVLLNYGFAAYALQEVQSELPLPALPVHLAEEQSVTPVLTDNTVLLKKEQLGTLRQEPVTAEELTAPLAAGEQVGTLTLYSDNERIAELPLVLACDIEKISFRALLGRVYRFVLFSG